MGTSSGRWGTRGSVATSLARALHHGAVVVPQGTEEGRSEVGVQRQPPQVVRLVGDLHAGLLAHEPARTEHGNAAPDHRSGRAVLADRDVQRGGGTPQLREHAGVEHLEPVDVQPPLRQRQVVAHVLDVRVDGVVGQRQLDGGAVHLGRLVEQATDGGGACGGQRRAEVADEGLDVGAGEDEAQVERAPRAHPPRRRRRTGRGRRHRGRCRATTTRPCSWSSSPAVMGVARPWWGIRRPCPSAATTPAVPRSSRRGGRRTCGRRR